MSRKTQQNNITSKEALERICDDNKCILREFLAYLKAVNRSIGTIEQYKSDIEIFFVWNLEFNANKPFAKITKRNIIAYQSWLINENKNSPARVRRLKAALSSMSNYIESVLSEDEPEYANFRNIINKIESPVNEPVREKTVFSEEDIERLLTRLVEKKKYEQACAVALAAYSGRRKSELGRFMISDFDSSHLICDGALYKSNPLKTKGRGVNGKMLECYTLAKRFQPYLDLWKKYREENGITSEFLLVDPKDKVSPISTSTLNSWANTFSKILGISYYWHSLRHAFTSLLAQSGIPDGVIADIVGWSDVSLVAVYNDTPKDNQIAAWFKNGEINTDKKQDISSL